MWEAGDDITIQSHSVASSQSNGLGAILDGDGFDAGVASGATDGVLSSDGVFRVVFPLVPTVSQ